MVHLLHPFLLILFKVKTIIVQQWKQNDINIIQQKCNMIASQLEKV